MNSDAVTLVLVLLLVAVVGVAVAATVGAVKGGLPQPAADVPPPLDGPVADPLDLDRARFQLAFRGYRMDQVDRVLDDARDALAARDDEIARLRQALSSATAETTGEAAAGGLDEPDRHPWAVAAGPAHGDDAGSGAADRDEAGVAR